MQTKAWQRHRFNDALQLHCPARAVGNGRFVSPPRQPQAPWENEKNEMPHTYERVTSRAE